MPHSRPPSNVFPVSLLDGIPAKWGSLSQLQRKYIQIMERGSLLTGCSLPSVTTPNLAELVAKKTADHIQGGGIDMLATVGTTEAGALSSKTVTKNICCMFMFSRAEAQK